LNFKLISSFYATERGHAEKISMCFCKGRHVKC